MLALKFVLHDALGGGAPRSLRSDNLGKTFSANLLRLEIDVPDDVALVGMDNSDLSALTWPALTTVDLGSSERARLAAMLLLARIEQPGRDVQVVGVEPRLVVRASSGAPA